MERDIDYEVAQDHMEQENGGGTPGGSRTAPDGRDGSWLAYAVTAALIIAAGIAIAILI